MPENSALFLQAQKSRLTLTSSEGVSLDIRAICCETTHLGWVGRNLSTGYNFHKPIYQVCRMKHFVCIRQNTAYKLTFSRIGHVVDKMSE